MDGSSWPENDFPRVRLQCIAFMEIDREHRNFKIQSYPDGSVEGTSIHNF